MGDTKCHSTNLVINNNDDDARITKWHITYLFDHMIYGIIDRLKIRKENRGVLHIYMYMELLFVRKSSFIYLKVKISGEYEQQKYI